jgi:hypothetical protein
MAARCTEGGSHGAGTPLPFALSLSKGPCIVRLSNDLSLSKGFDKLSPSGHLRP